MQPDFYDGTVDLTEDNFYDFIYDWYRTKQEYSPQAKPLIPSLESISSTGELTIKFNKDMLVPDQLLADKENGSQLAKLYLMSYLLDLSVISNIEYEGADTEKLDIRSYEMVSYEKKTLKIQVNFIYPE